MAETIWEKNMKKITLILLLMVSTNVFAEWTKANTNKAAGLTTYVDLQSIRKKGNKVKMWELWDFKTIQKSPIGESFLSSANHKEYDCEEETSKTLNYTWYSGNMGKGDSVYSSGNLNREPESIIPETLDDTSFKAACNITH